MQLGAALGFTKDKISKIERGKQFPNAEEIRAWATVCDADHIADSLIQLLTESRSTRLDWDKRLTGGQEPVQASYLDLVTASSRIINVSPFVIPGQLQTAGYARQVLAWSEARHGAKITDIDQAVANRLAAGQFLHDPTKRWTFVLTEAALRFRYVDDAEMLIQLDRLLSVLGLPTVELGIIPLDARLDGIVSTDFVIYDNQILIDTYAEEHHYRGGTKLEVYLDGAQAAQNLAVQGDRARVMIQSAIGRYGPQD